VLGVKMLPQKPVSPIVAAATGNALGGVAVGITAGMSANEKKRAYDKALKEFDATNASIDECEKAVLNYYNLVIEFLRSHPDYETAERMEKELEKELPEYEEKLDRLKKELEEKEKYSKNVKNKITTIIHGQHASLKEDIYKTKIEISHCEVAIRSRKARLQDALGTLYEYKGM
jgi:chromosome segregation ATPase